MSREAKAVRRPTSGLIGLNLLIIGEAEALCECSGQAGQAD
jgi:hypothetical protein